MLHLENIEKTYTGNGINVKALKGVSITFRDSEFVSVLGPSGCGKTTLLNIIGGLDHATGGDLVINGVSTKKYKDRDWDTYRNHSVGFVFQSYNLIPHQTILQNVELALNISGIPKAERLQRAKDALDKVGLEGIYNKKPNQLSGGQCQRVAIARALVGDPEVLLADEPTGALDTVTSIQIMDLIKEISKERLVIMVTHNPDIAEKYSTRIVKLLDGNIVDDSDPFDGTAEEQAGVDAAEHAEPASSPTRKNTDKRSKLSFWSAFRLSARNLLSKFKRTLLVCLAGSIGIIGVATVLSVSTGISAFIDRMQNDMLTGSPVQIQRSTMNFEGLTALQNRDELAGAIKDSYKDGVVNVDNMIAFLAKQGENLSDFMVQNNITQEYVDYIKQMPEELTADISYRYGLYMSNSMYTDYNFTGSKTQRTSLAAAQDIYISLLGETVFKDDDNKKLLTSMAAMLKVTYSQAPTNADFILSQYDIVEVDGIESRVASEADEIMIVLGADDTLTDLFLAQLGFFSQDEFVNITYKVNDDPDDPKYDPSLDRDHFDYADLYNKKISWYPNRLIYSENNNPLFSSYKNIMPFMYNNIEKSAWKNDPDHIDFKVTAVLRPKKDLAFGTMSSGIYYTPALVRRIIDLEKEDPSPIVKFLLDDKDKRTSYNLANKLMPPMYMYSFRHDGKTYNKLGVAGSSSMLDNMDNIIASFTNAGNNQTEGGVSGGLEIPEGGTSEEVLMEMMAEYMSYSLSLRHLGGIDLPSSIALYSTDFELKDQMTAYLDRWNSEDVLVVNGVELTKEQRGQDIIYTDTLAVVMAMISDMITAVTAALIAFTALSLIVSTVMIAIITYVSVIERVKEIGVIRAMGGRKRDVSNLFTAETFIIGFVSGVLGIFITFLLTVLINAIVAHFASVGAIATLTPAIIFIMIGVSVVLTLISGLFPASAAAKKDPVEALRTE